MIAWAAEFLRPRKRMIRIREPQSFILHTNAPCEKIDAVFDPAGRIITLIVYTRTKSLRS